VARGAVKWFNRASGYGLIEPYEGGGDLLVHRASLDESVLATAGERVEFEWREGGMGREAINVAASSPETGRRVLSQESRFPSAEPETVSVAACISK
jgi:CspA family cold shock protein